MAQGKAVKIPMKDEYLAGYSDANLVPVEVAGSPISIELCLYKRI